MYGQNILVIKGVLIISLMFIQNKRTKKHSFNSA